MSGFLVDVPATSEIYTLSLHDALPICRERGAPSAVGRAGWMTSRRYSLRPPKWWSSGLFLCDVGHAQAFELHDLDRKSTRLNSSHGYISYAVFCLKKKKLALHCGHVTH